MSRDIIISITIQPTSFLNLSYYLNIKWVISSTISKILTNIYHDRFIFERRQRLLKQCIMGSVSSTLFSISNYLVLFNKFGMNSSQTTSYWPSVCIPSAYRATLLCQCSCPHGRKFWESSKLSTVSTVYPKGHRRSLAVLHRLPKFAQRVAYMASHGLV